MDKEARKAVAQVLLQRCVDSGINFPRTKTAAQNLVECGTVLMANRQGDAFDDDAAFEQLRNKYGVVAQKAEGKSAESKSEESEDAEEVKAPSRKRKAKASTESESKSETKAESKDDDGEGSDNESDSDDEGGKKKKKKKTAKKPQVKISEQAVVPENKDLALAFHFLSRESFRVQERMPGMAYAKVAKILREFPEVIRSADQLKGVKGVGKASIAKIGEYLENGFINKLEELRATM